MSVLIPASINWIIKKRAKLGGELVSLKHERQLLREKLLGLVEQIEGLEQGLQTLDSTLSLHDLGIDPQQIVPVGRNDSTVISSGKMTRSIFRVLAALPNTWVTTTELTQMVVEDNGETMDEFTFAYFRYCLRHRAKVLYRQGRIQRQWHPKGKLNVEANWSIRGEENIRRASLASNREPRGRPRLAQGANVRQYELWEQPRLMGYGDK